jgi:hypothetical protein
VPEPPGWRPGQRPPSSPFSNVGSNDDFRRRFRAAVLDELRRGSGRRGPTFGSRKTEFLPYLVVRANAGDRGARPLAGPFWESPDIFVVANMHAAAAPAIPPTHGGLAVAGRPNTLWAHVWNLGNAPVANARVEFYWCDPALGFNAASVNLIGVAHVDLGDRSSGMAHTIVRCPSTWVPSYVSGGHECLIVRCFDPLTDPLGPGGWNAWDDRHVGQRNIHVAIAASPAVAQIPVRLGCAVPPGPSQIEIMPVRPESVGWLSCLTGRRESTLKEAGEARDVFGLMFPTRLRSVGDRPSLADLDPEALGPILRRQIDFERGCDELETLAFVRVDGLRHGECKAYRIEQRIGGRVTGGYTIVAVQA